MPVPPPRPAAPPRARGVQRVLRVGCRLRRLHRVGRRPGPDPVPRAGGGGAGPGRWSPRRARDPDRLGQVARGRGRARAGPRAGAAQLVHRADQGPGQREVLRPRRDLRGRAGRHAHRRRRGEPCRPHHLRHRRGPGQPRPARPGTGRHRPRRHGRVPLLHRARPRLGVAGAAAAPARHPVPPHVGDAGRHPPVRGGPHPPHRPRDHRGHRDRAPRAAGVRVGAHARSTRPSSCCCATTAARSTWCRSPSRRRSSRRRR
jgi:hypothetical protein